MADQQTDESPVHDGAGPVPLEAVLCTEELKRRPARGPDYQTENRALVTLAQALADSPRSVLQTLANTLLEVFKAGSAGVSLLSQDEKSFFWPAIAGQWQPHIGGGTPRDCGPSGDVLDCNAPLLFKHPERRYSYFLPVMPLAQECLLVPFHVSGKAVGTIWVIAHNQRRKFDAEDLRQLESLGRFASAAYQTVQSLDAELAQRHAALGLSEDSVRSGLAMEKLNAEFRESEEKRRLALDSAELGTFNIDPATHALTTDARFRVIFGFAGERIGYEQAFATVHPEDRLQQRNAVAAATRPDDPVPYATEYRVVHPDGSLHWVFAQARVNFAQQGSVRKLLSFDGTVADITERKQAENSWRESEAFTRSIIASSPDCIKVLDLKGNLLSMQSGQELLGIEDIRPFLNTSWITFWQGEHRHAAQAAIESATAGEVGRFVGFFRTLRGEPKWWDVAVSPILDADGKPARLLAVSRDVTEQRHREMNLEFLASFSHDLMHWTNAQEMMQTVGAKVGAHLQLSLCAFAEINETAEQVVINHDWHRDDVPGLAGTYRLADFVEGEFIRMARAGEVIVVRDAVTDPRTDPEKFATLKIASFLCVPLVRDGQWRFALCLYKSEAYDWREDEIELTRELTARIWTRLERLRAEAAVCTSEQRYRTLFESIDEGFCIIEKVAGEAGAPLDFRYVEANEAFAVQSGLRDVVGKTIRQVVPDESEEWFTTYDAVLRTGESIRFEQGLVSRGRVLELYALRVQDETQRRVAVIFKDVTGRKQAEEALRQRTAQFEALFNDVPLGVYLIDADFRVRHVNPTALPAFGDIPELIGRDFAEVLHILWPQERADETIKQFRHTLETGESCQVPELIEQRADRKATEYYEWQINRISLPDGRHGVVCYFRDISGRVLAQQQLRASEERYRSLFNSIDEGYCTLEMIFDQNDKAVDYRYLEVNPSFEKLTGMHGALGKRIRELVPDLEEYWFEIYGKVALTGEPIRFFNEAKPMNRWFDVYAFRFGGTESRKVAILFNDITERIKSEAALRQSEERFRVLVTASSDVVYRMNPDWSEMRQLHGRSFIADTETPSGNWLQEYIDPADQPHVMAVVNDAIRTRSLFEMEHRVRLVDGSFGWTFSHAVPLLDAAGDIVEWFGTASDVTAHKQAQQALRESEDRYRSLFNSMDQGYCIIEMIFDEHSKPVDWLYLEVNPSFEKMSGMRDALGKRIRELVPDLEEYWFETYGKVALTGEAVRLFNEVKPLNSWFDLYAFRFGAAESRKVAVLFTNITDQIKAAEALRRSEERFRALFDWGPIAMYSCGSAGTIQEYNQGAVKLWGRTPKPGETDEQFRGSFKTFLPDGTFLPYAQTAMTRILKSEIPAMHDMEVVVERPDGSRITLVVNVVPLKDDAGEVTGAITCFYDVTERSRLEHRLQEQAQALTDLDRRKDEFLAMLSHELRNPLAPLTNAVHLLRLQKNEDPVQRQARSIIERQVGQLKHLVGDLLEISRITTGRVQLRRVRIAMSGIVERAIETAQPLIEQRRHELTVSQPPQPVWLQADPARLEQVLVNLLTNAAKYTDEGGQIWVTVQQEGDEAVLRVRDTGVGIAPELLPRIFELFTQAERSLDRSQGGLGIGLCLVQRLVDLHGGTVTASSVLGQGSEFVVRLPAMPMDLPQLSSPLPATETAQPPGTGCRVLVVDDNVDAAQSLSDLLEATGHVVRLAHDGPAALDVLQAFQADLVLLDIGLPGLTGLEVAKRIRQLPVRGDIVLAAMTGYGQDTDRQRSKDAGFDHHLVKPADFGELEKILEAVSKSLRISTGALST